tara:strand:+ start:7382 stop:7534 length:153 start_codon:yes stop_codon:yes gene_type:complete
MPGTSAENCPQDQLRNRIKNQLKNQLKNRSKNEPVKSCMRLNRFWGIGAD